MNEEVLILIAHMHARTPVMPGDVIWVSSQEADWMEQHQVAERMRDLSDPPASGVETHDDNPRTLDEHDTSKPNARKK
ncbi:TPA: DUF7210 family protein [Serratia marcescens]